MFMMMTYLFEFILALLQRLLQTTCSSMTTKVCDKLLVEELMDHLHQKVKLAVSSAAAEGRRVLLASKLKTEAESHAGIRMHILTAKNKASELLKGRMSVEVLRKFCCNFDTNFNL